MSRYIHLSETASTNSYLSRVASALPSGSVIYTYKQTAEQATGTNTVTTVTNTNETDDASN